jgi:hypothetical protein
MFNYELYFIILKRHHQLICHHLLLSEKEGLCFIYGKYKWIQITNVLDLLRKKSSVMINYFWTALTTSFGGVEELGTVISFQYKS